MVGAAAASTQPDRQTRRALEALNFFMADMQAGIGPFLGVFLQQRGWATGAIGLVMTLGGVAGMAVTAPAGAVIDATTRKRAYVIASGVFTVLASALIWVSQRFWVIAGSQVATAIAGAALGPAVVGITLGVARQKGFNRQNGRNQAFNHAGNMVGAGLSGLLGWKFGFGAIFWLAAIFGLFTIAAVLLIPAKSIDHRAARGLEAAGEDHQAKSWKVLWECKPLLVLAAALALFHLGNGAMLPLYGLAVVAAHKGDPAGFVAMTIVVAQAVMVGASLIAMTMAERRGFWLVILITFIALPIRGLVAASVIQGWGVFPVQALDGIGAGLQSVAVPGLVARILSGTGRVNVGQGAVLTVQGIGAALSPAIGGAIAQAVGYRVTFLVLGGFALGSLALWLAFRPLLKPACDRSTPQSVTTPAAA
ncbi:MFS transporter [Phenylobacterium sp.]|uniref:MFS transporter n=1 Tax=Phenylobacterium sp. TaxID=1871053 RepID=UPI0012196D38|nr:MFS transporter [Phenylobacterium sp.]THD59288.1 MAG: MFS transporter [Phenylobacterium sp.]